MHTRQHCWFHLASEEALDMIDAWEVNDCKRFWRILLGSRSVERGETIPTRAVPPPYSFVSSRGFIHYCEKHTNQPWNRRPSDVGAYLDIRKSPRKHGFTCKTRLIWRSRYVLASEERREKTTGELPNWRNGGYCSLWPVGWFCKLPSPSKKKVITMDH